MRDIKRGYSPEKHNANWCKNGVLRLSPRKALQHASVGPTLITVDFKQIVPAYCSPLLKYMMQKLYNYAVSLCFSKTKASFQTVQLLFSASFSREEPSRSFLVHVIYDGPVRVSASLRFRPVLNHQFSCSGIERQHFIVAWILHQFSCSGIERQHFIVAWILHVLCDLCVAHTCHDADFSLWSEGNGRKLCALCQWFRSVISFRVIQWFHVTVT